MGYRLDIIAVLPILLTIGVVLTVPVYEVTKHGEWGEWKNISQCYAKSCNNSCGIKKGDCDKGEMEQIRFCNNPSPGYGGRWCHGRTLQTVGCENHVRPGWSEWGPVKCEEDCRRSDNVTVKGHKRRTCNNPPPIHTNDMCCGDEIQHTEDDSKLCEYLPICIYTTASTTSTSSTTKVTCPTTQGFEYGNEDKQNIPIKKDDYDSYDYSDCS